VLEDLNSTNGIYVRSKRVRRRMLNDGDVVQIGQHEIMYFDERTNRSRTAFHEIEDDAQLMSDPLMGGDRGHAATLAQDDNRPLEEHEEEDEQDELRSP
jgi:general secretion pathway protein A